MAKTAAIFILFLTCLANANGQLPDYHVQVINSRNGVNLAGAKEVKQDKKGFLWILSENSVQRYDGKSVKIFEPAPMLKNIFFDADGNAWCVAQRSVFRFVNDFKGFEEIPVDTNATFLFAIHQLPDKSLWVSHTKGLLKYFAAEKRFVPVTLPFLKNFGRLGGPGNLVVKEVQQQGNLFCLLQQDTAYVYDVAAGNVLRQVLPKLNFAVFVNDQRVLMASYDAYSYQWDLDNDIVRKTSYSPDPDDRETFFYASQALSIGRDDHYLLSNKGLLRVTGQTPNIKRVRLFLDGTPLLQPETIRYISRGNDGKIFLLYENAILYFDRQSQGVETIKGFSSDLSKNFSNHPTECVMDDDQNLWIASYNGFTRWNLVTNEFRNYNAFTGKGKENLHHPIVFHIIRDGKNILIAPDQQGILIFNPRTEQFSRPVFTSDSAGKKMESQANRATAFFIRRLRGGKILFANRYGAFVMEKDSYRVRPLNLPKNKMYYLTAIETQDGFTWFGTMRGLVALDSNLVLKKELPTPGKHKEALVLCQTGTNEIMVGNEEIYTIRDPLGARPDFRPYLPFFNGKKICTLFKDTVGHMWIVTSDAVYRYHIEANLLEKVTHPDFVVRQHQMNGLFEARDGTVFFCSENGLNYFRPSPIAAPEKQKPVYITNITINNDDSGYVMKGTFASRLAHDQNSLIFDYAMPHLGALPVRYRYRLQGFDANWIDAGMNNQVRYAALPPGNYQFEVSASVDGINWNNSQEHIAFTIIPPFWRTGWFIALCVAAISGAGYAAYRYRQNWRQEKEAKQMIDYFANSGYEHSSVDDILWDIARNCISRLDFEDCVIYLLDEDSDMLHQKAAYGPKSPKAFEIKDPIVIPLGKGIVGTVAQTGKPEVIRDTTRDTRYIIDDKARLSEITVPIIHEGRVIGIIDSEHRRKNFFQESHLKVLQTIANLCSAKISRAMAFDAMNKSKIQLMELNMKMAESKFLNLRLQMNPHFLFNSLSSIQHLVVSQQTSKAYKYLTVFSNLLRMLLQYAEANFISLDQEMSILRKYLDLETLRFDESFSYSIEVDESLEQEEVLIPSLMVQPFAENAIWHGLMHKEGEKKLYIRFANHHDDYLTCIVEDNGIGRKCAAEIQQKKISSMVHESKGIRIIRERLSLLQQKTGKPAKVDIIDKGDDAGQPSGTKVVIVIPFYNKEEE